MESIAKERLETAVRNILGNDNFCGTLANAVQKRDADYFRRAVAPVVKVYEEEGAALRTQLAEERIKVEDFRFALESVVANMRIVNPDVKVAVERALGRKI